MRRRLIAAVWVAGATVPLLIAAVFLVGCCALPFHGVLHKLMPLCEMAANAAHGEHEHDAATPPARGKQEPVKRVPSAMPPAMRVAANESHQLVTPSASKSYRSFISLGATRCDRDVGLHVLVDTFRI